MIKCVYCSDNSTQFVYCTDQQNNCVAICKNCYDIIQNIPCSVCGENIETQSAIDKDTICLQNGIVNKYGFICRNCTDYNNVDSFIYKNNNLKEYYYKPNCVFKKLLSENKNNLYLGVELQVGLVDSQSVVNNFCNNHAGSIFYFKRDGSIARCGCQIVTYPCTLGFHKSKLSNWSQLFSDLNTCGFKSGVEANTGIHIHINRSFLTTEQIKKIDLFVNLYKDLFIKLSRRNESTYAKYTNKTLRSWGHSTTSRYSAINLQNTHTIQFRIFNGSVQINDLFSSLQLVHCLVNFVKQVTYEQLYDMKKKTIDKFFNFVTDNRVIYNNLHDLINRLQLRQI